MKSTRFILPLAMVATALAVAAPAHALSSWSCTNFSGSALNGKSRTCTTVLSAATQTASVNLPVDCSAAIKVWNQSSANGTSTATFAVGPNTAISQTIQTFTASTTASSTLLPANSACQVWAKLAPVGAESTTFAVQEENTVRRTHSE